MTRNDVPDDSSPSEPLPDDSSPTEPLPDEPLPDEPLTAESLFGQPEPAAAQPTLPYPVAPTPSPGVAAETLPRPRIRWAGVVWGVLFAAFGIATMSILASTSNQIAVGSWIAGLGPWGAGVVALVAVGALVLILGVLSALNRPAR